MMRSLTVEELGHLTSAKVYGNPSYVITGIESLEEASPCQASFLENSRYEQQMRLSQAGVIFVSPHVSLSEGKNYLIVENPSLAFQKAIEFFIEPALSGFENIHPTAVIHKEAFIDKGVVVGPYTVIDRGVSIGKGTKISAQVFIGPETHIGENCLIDSQVTIYERSHIGNRVILQSGCVIGSSGFGYFTDKKGKHHLLKQMGIVVIEDDVDIGANTAIDRARFTKTIIRQGTKIDNLVQLAHQVDIGEDNLIVSQVGIAGSTTTGKNVVIAGQVGIVGHISIGDGVIIAARSGVSKSLTQPGMYGGAPAMPFKDFSEQIVHIRSIKKLMSRIEELENKVKNTLT